MRGIFERGRRLWQLQRFKHAGFRQLVVLTWDGARQHRFEALAPERASQLDLRERNRGIAATSHAFNSPAKLRFVSAPHDSLTTREQGIRRTPASLRPAIISRSRALASRPSASRFMSTLVSGGRRPSAMTSQLSKPTTATVGGHGAAEVAQSLDRAAGDLVVAAEERVRRRPPALEQALRSPRAPSLPTNRRPEHSSACAARPASASAVAIPCLGAGAPPRSARAR